ncbi:MAG: hypothetical protein J6X61_05885 [Clostridia bacterium]|nr:hypothetical protein [Clostridia bacterium]
MSALGECVSALCVFGVVLGVVSLLLPQDGLGDFARMGGRLLMVGLALKLLLAFPAIDWETLAASQAEPTVDAEHYISDRLAESARGPIEDEVKKVLGQFGINHGQIRIEFDKGDHGALSLAHIGVGVPKAYAADRLAIKRLLLSRFDVYCDVYLLEEPENED